MMKQPIIGEPLPRFKDWAQQMQEISFYRNSYKGGPRYIRSVDSLGHPVLLPHPKERSDGYNFRVRNATLFNYVRPIINRYNDLVFMRKPDRNTIEDQDFINNVDGHGSHMNEVSEKVLKNAQIDGKAFLFLDSNSDIEGTVSVLDAQRLGLRAIVRSIKSTSVPYYVDTDNGTILGAYIVVHDSAPFAVQVNDTAWRRIEITDDHQMVVKQILPWISHGYNKCPLVKVEPIDDSAQAADISNIQKLIFNLYSLLTEELFGSTFTQWVATGASVDDISNVEKGVNRLIIVDKQGVNFTKLGSDPAQATSIRDAIKDAINELYRSAGLTSGNALDTSSPISGVALAFLQGGMVSSAAALSRSMETAENRLLEIAGIDGRVIYNKEFNATDENKELENTLKIVESSMPQAIKNEMIKRWSEFASIDERVIKALDSAVEPLQNNQE